MSLPDGEYDIDISALMASHRPETLAIRYGFVPELMDQSKPLVLYDDGQNLVLEATDTSDETMVFEGFGNTHAKTSRTMDTCYLRLDGPNKVTLSELGATIRVNRSRNLIKWKNLIAKWNSELQSEHITSLHPGGSDLANAGLLQDDPEIISESDFENLDSEFPVFDLNLGDDLERELEAALDDTLDEKKPATAAKKGPQEKKKPAEPAAESSKAAGSQDASVRASSKLPAPAEKKSAQAKPSSARAPMGPKTAVPSNRPTPESKPRPLPASLPQKPSITASPQPSHGVPKRGGGALRSTKATVAAKRPLKPASRASKRPAKPSASSVPDDDDFKDLEDQLQEVLEDSSGESDSFVGGGVTILDEPPKKTNIYTSTTLSKPMSLREFMGEKTYDDDSSSEEE